MSAPFTLGILETGRPPEEMAAHFPTYVQMFTEMVSATAPQDWDYRAFTPMDGELPPSPTACDAWLITGSKFGAYEDHTWIHALIDFLRSAYDAKVPMVGICFGHQVLAQALGGRVAKSDKGWGVGTNRYSWTDNKPDWLAGTELADRADFAIQAFHQDQIIDLPPDAHVLAQSDFCPNAALAYGDQVVSFQGHPEFSAEFVGELIRVRRESMLGDAVADKAEAELHLPIDMEAIWAGIVAFLKTRAADKASS